MSLPTHYAKSGDVSIAYQVVGDGPLDLVFVMGWVTHLDAMWEEPRFARFLQRLAGFSRLILFDKRGTGLSDPVPLHALPTLEQRMDDIRAVMDAVGCERAAILGISEAGALSMLFAATYPERTTALILIGCYARRLWAVDHPWGYEPDDVDHFFEQMERDWGAPIDLKRRAPSAANDPAFRDWWARYLRMGASRGAAMALTRMAYATDVRPILSAIHAPTLVIHRTAEQLIPVAEARFLAKLIPSARLVELPGDDHLPFVGDQEAILAEVELFLTGTRPAPEADRMLATMMMVEIVGVAETAARLGDRRWSEVCASYDVLVREAVNRFRGREASRTVEGGLATFDGPARAVRCAEEIVRGARGMGLQVRAGLHTGEVVVVREGIIGVALHLATQVARQAAPGEVVVSNTVKDLVVGSGLAFQPLGDRVFPGLPGEWRLFRLANETSAAQPKPQLPPIEAIREAHSVRLTARELEVLRLLAAGHSNREVGEKLFISPTPAARHVANIYSKLGVDSRVEAAAYAHHHGLI
jgi:pimeloyl-ACP methyl ester carboxylesterase/DNA-binding CsgD family transcriptional regulator